MWSTCKVVQHVHSLHRHALRLGGFLRLFVRSCTGWEWSTCRVVHDPLHRCIPGGLGGVFAGGTAPAGGPAKTAFSFALVLMRNYELRPLGGRAGGAPGQLADGRQRGGQARAARPCWRRSRRACLSFNKLHEHLFRGETAFGVGFSAAYGSTRFNRLPGFCKPGSVPPAAPRVSIFCRQNHR